LAKSAAVKWGRLGGVLVLAGLSLLASRPAAAETNGIVVTPPFQEVVLNPSDPSKEFTITLTNRTDTDQQIVVSALDFKSLDESGGVAFVGQDETKYGVATWLSLDKPSLLLPKHSSATVPVTIRNESSLASGGHYGAVRFMVSAGDASGSNRVTVRQNVASLLFVKKLGGEHYSLTLSAVEQPKNWLSGEQAIGLRFYNSGNIHAVPRGTVELVRGKTVYSRGVINSESGIILPESFRRYTTKLLGLKGVKPGRYTLKVTYRYDGSDKLETYEQSVFIFDATFMGLVGGIGLATAALAVYGARQWRGRKAGLKSRHATA
jgi:hypothetical protein